MSPKVTRGRPNGRPGVVREEVDPMGRGRAKAKQTKVARQLKYQTFDTDFDALERELSGDKVDQRDDGDEYDPYAEYDRGNVHER